MTTVTSEPVSLDKSYATSSLPAAGDRAMEPFVELPHDVRENQMYREALLAQPPEFFQGYCEGRVPDVFERLHLVERLVQAVAAPKAFANNIYRVQVRPEPPMVHLIVCRLDGEPCKDWYHFQQIKNELVGPECEAVELFPAESRLVDMGNEYHMWVNASPVARFPFGYERRHVMENPIILWGGSSGEAAPCGVGAPLHRDSSAKVLP